MIEMKNSGVQKSDSGKTEEQAKALAVDFDTLRAMSQEDIVRFEKEQKSRRRMQEMRHQTTAEQAEKNEKLNKLFVASILPILLVIAALSIYFSATKVEIKEAYPLFVETVPYDANIQIVNIEPKYEMGILLKPDSYLIRISKKGYMTQEFWIKMGNDTMVVKRELKAVKKRKVY